MALILCPECGKQVSDKAASCPNCGAPISGPPKSQAPSGTGESGERLGESGERPVEVYNPRQDQFLTRNRGCLEVFVWLGLAILIIAGLKSCMS